MLAYIASSLKWIKINNCTVSLSIQYVSIQAECMSVFRSFPPNVILYFKISVCHLFFSHSRSLSLLIYLSITHSLFSVGFLWLLFEFEPTNFSIQFHFVLSTSDSLENGLYFYLNKIVEYSCSRIWMEMLKNHKENESHTRTRYIFIFI